MMRKILTGLHWTGAGITFAIMFIFIVPFFIYKLLITLVKASWVFSAVLKNAFIKGLNINEKE